MAEPKEVEEVKATPLVNALRTIEFWRRASGVYAAYKGAQVNAMKWRRQCGCYCSRHQTNQSWIADAERV